MNFNRSTPILYYPAEAKPSASLHVGLFGIINAKEPYSYKQSLVGNSFLFQPCKCLKKMLLIQPSYNKTGATERHRSN